MQSRLMGNRADEEEKAERKKNHTRQQITDSSEASRSISYLIFSYQPHTNRIHPIFIFIPHTSAQQKKKNENEKPYNVT